MKLSLTLLVSLALVPLASADVCKFASPAGKAFLEQLRAANGTDAKFAISALEKAEAAKKNCGKRNEDDCAQMACEIVAVTATKYRERANKEFALLLLEGLPNAKQDDDCLVALKRYHEKAIEKATEAEQEKRAAKLKGYDKQLEQVLFATNGILAGDERQMPKAFSACYLKDAPVAK